MLFSAGLFIAAGATISVALLDKVTEDLGIYWLNTFVKLILPLIGFALAIYFLETNPLMRWLK